MGINLHEHMVQQPPAQLSTTVAVFADKLLFYRLLQFLLCGVQIMLRKRWRVITLLTVAFVALAAIGYRAAVHAFAVMPLNRHPFTATVEHYTVSNGQEVIHHVDHVGRTSSGAQVSWGVPSGMNVEVRSIKLPSGWGGMVIDAIKAKSTGQRPDIAVAEHNAQLTNTPADCVVKLPGTVNGLRKVGEEVLMTQTAYLLQQTATVNGKQMRITFWAFPRYSCMKLQMKQEEADSKGNWTVVRGTHLTALAEIPPPAEKFIVPAGFQEMRPSEQALKLVGPTVSAEQKQKIQQSSGDENYLRWHK